MTKIVIVDRNGSLQTINSKQITKDTLYKKCKFRGRRHMLF